MDVLVAIASGIVCGVTVAMPLMRQLQSSQDDIGRGFGAVILAFFAIQIGMLAVHAYAPALLMPFGASTILTYIACVFWAVVRRGSV